MELPKIGRNPSDFGHVYDITLGARVYNDPAAAEFSDLGSASETLDQGAPAEFVVQVVEEPESAISMISSFAACIMVLFALNFWASLQTMITKYNNLLFPCFIVSAPITLF